MTALFFSDTSRAVWRGTATECLSAINRLLQLYPLRTGDAFQLAAALYTQRSVTTPIRFVCLDRQLTEAARGEGFTVEP